MRPTAPAGSSSPAATGSPHPPGSTIGVEALETLTDVEQTKKVANLPNLRPELHHRPRPSETAPSQAAGGNPRLLDWLDKIVADTSLDVDGLITAIENEADRFRRENIFAEKLLGTQPIELQKMLAKLNVVELPVPAATVYAIHDHPEAASHVKRAAQLGLLEEGTDPETDQPRYFVSNVLRPLIRPLLTDDEYTQACAAAARSLYEIWVTDPRRAADTDAAMTSVARWVEVHRLAVAGGEAGIARDVGDRVGRVWLARSRFADVAAGWPSDPDPGRGRRRLLRPGWAKRLPGSPGEALAAYDAGAAPVPGAGDRGNEAATLSNIGRVYDGLGDRQRALDYYQQALPIRREVGDRAGEATTLNNIGHVYDGLGDRQRALDYYQQALPIRREVGDRAGEATTLNNIGHVYDGLGDRQRALDYYQQALPIRREVGDRAGEAATLNNIGRVYDGLGDRRGRWSTTSRPCPSCGRSGTGPVRPSLATTSR